MHLVTHFLITLSVLAGAGPVAGHEFWLSPEAYQIEPSETVAVNLRVGQDFSGAPNSYIPDRIARFEAGFDDARSPVAGRLGDRPAAVLTPDQEGLYVIVHETTDFRLTYREAKKFTNFVEQHDLQGVADRHAERELPETGFVEAFRRYAKSLIAVGGGAGADTPVGLEVEIIAEDNPYTTTGSHIQVQLMDRGEPRAGAQLEVHVRHPRAKRGTLTLLRADETGRVEVPREPGTEVLLNFVVMRETDGTVEQKSPVWRSLWASMTYAVP